ncbi:MAG: glutamine-hydrolyzing GMP synthase, partial [Candidatus Binatia bacterium]
MILILDFGSQYTQLIARCVRESNVYCEIHPFNISREKIRQLRPKGIVLSGSPASVYQENAPQVQAELFDFPVPFLGICYGMGLINRAGGGEVARADQREYGLADLFIKDNSDLFHGFTQHKGIRVWMSHGDHMTSLPEGWNVLAQSTNSPIAAFSNPERRLFGVQFHPEVTHTPRGKETLNNFLFRICKCEPTWTMAHFIETSVETISKRVGQSRVLCALSGGVDSSVAATLVHRAIGDRLICIFVDNGLLRQREAEEVCQLGGRFGEGFHHVDASARFVSALQGVEDPEEKRRRIGHLFIEVFEEEAMRLGEIPYLTQGTL